MSRRLVLATFASETVMGAQVYERAIRDHAKEALAPSAEEWTVKHAVVRSLRSPLPGTRRVPVGWMLGASRRERELLARTIYPRADVVHRMKMGLPPAPDRDVLTLHDVGPWKFPDEARPVPAAPAEIRRARAIITPSAFSAAEIVDLFGVDDPVVIPNGFDAERFTDASPLSREQLHLLGITGPYILAAGGASERKNLAGLADAWHLARKALRGVTLVIAGPPHPRRSSLFAGRPGVVLTGRVDDALLPRLMAGAQALVIPSLYEGFGLPALEGMAVGVPVVAIRASSLPEVLGPAGVLAEPSPSSLAEGVIWALSGDREISKRVELGKLRAKNYSWARSAAAHAALWRRLAA